MRVWKGEIARACRRVASQPGDSRLSVAKRKWSRRFTTGLEVPDQSASVKETHWGVPVRRIRDDDLSFEFDPQLTDLPPDSPPILRGSAMAKWEQSRPLSYLTRAAHFSWPEAMAEGGGAIPVALGDVRCPAATEVRNFVNEGLIRPRSRRRAANGKRATDRSPARLLPGRGFQVF